MVSVVHAAPCGTPRQSDVPGAVDVFELTGQHASRSVMLRVVLLLGGAALLLLLLWHLGPSDVVEVFGRVGWYFVPVLLLGAAHQATRALALRACVLRRHVLRYRD